MKKTSALFRLNPGDTPALLHADPEMGEVWAAQLDGRPQWTLKTPGMVYSFAVHDTEPEQFVIHVVEEAAHRLRDVVNLKIDPKRIKNLALGPEASLEQVQIAVAHLDRWRGSAAQWMHDVEWQKWLQR